MGLSKDFLRRLREEQGEEEEEVEAKEKPPSVMLMIRVYSPDTLYMTQVPRPHADKMIDDGLATWVNEDAIKLTPASIKLAEGPGLTPEQKARRRARQERSRR